MKQQTNCILDLNDLYNVLEENSSQHVRTNTNLNTYRPAKVFYLSSVISKFPLAACMTHTEISPHIINTASPHLSP